MLCSILLFSTSQAQQLIFDRYTTDNGLSINRCNNIIQDEDGFMWIATSSGLNRFDGKNFVKYYSNGSAHELPGNVINKMLNLYQHKLVIGTDDGLAIFDTRTGEAQQLIIPAGDGLKQATNSISDIASDKKGDIIVGTNGGLYIFDAALKLIFRYDAYKAADIGKKRLFFNPSLYLLPNGEILMFGGDTFIYALNIEKKRLQNIKDIPGSEFKLLKPWNGTVGFVWGCNRYNQFFFIRYSPAIDSLFVVDLVHQRSSVSSLAFSAGREIYSGSKIIPLNDSLLSVSSNNHDGIFLLNFNANTMAATSSENILRGDFCNDIMTDKNKRLWVVSDEGFFKQSFSKSLFNVLLPIQIESDVADKPITGIIHYQNKYFINQWGVGTLVYNDSLHFIRSVSFTKPGRNNWPLDICYYSKDTLLIATFGGAVLLNTNDFTLKKFRQPGMPPVIDSNFISSSLIDSHHQLWLGIGGNGVLRMDISTHEWKYFSPKEKNPVFKLRQPFSMAEDRNGNIWMSSKEGITRWNWQKQIFDTLLKKLPGISDITGSWNFLTIDKQDNLWILEKDFVLVKWNLNTQLFTTFPRPGNIPPLRVDEIKGPWENCLWITTNKGLLSFNVMTEKFHLITKSDGLYDNFINSNIYFDTVTHRLLTGFNNAFGWFYSQDVLKEKKPVQTIITDIRKTGDSLSLAGDSSFRFSYKENSFIVEFTGINYEDGQNNTYAYRLYENNPTTFINIGEQKTVTLASLKPGNYTFQVKTILSDGTESMQPTSLHINIAYPFYETWWFYLLCTVVIAVGLYALYRYRVSYVLQVQNMRNTIASDLHDDIGSTLSSISIMSELAKGKSPEALSLLNSIGEDAASIQENMSDIVWAINPKNDRFENVLQRMNHFASEILGAKNIELDFTSDGSLSASRLTMKQRKNFYLFSKEVINNAAKYSGAKKVCVSILQKDHHIELDIRDDGKGFDTAKEYNANGMDTLKKRAAELKGDYKIHSALSEGTTVVLKFKIT